MMSYSRISVQIIFNFDVYQFWSVNGRVLFTANLLFLLILKGVITFERFNSAFGQDVIFYLETYQGITTRLFAS